MSAFSAIKPAPPDGIFALVARHKADNFPHKVDLSVGAYRDQEGKPWILPVVRKVDALVSSDPTLNHEYLPMAGMPDFNTSAARVVFGHDSPVIERGLVASIQTLSGTGANHTAALFLKKFYGKSTTIHVSNPTWANHKTIFEHAGLNIVQYPYFDPSTKGLDFDGLLGALQKAKEGDIVLLHACAHNPTGVDPTHDQWKAIAQVCKERKLFPFFDCAYQGFATGSLDNDAWAVRYFVDQGLELLVCQSFAKNFGLYGERAGALHVVVRDPNAVQATTSQLALLSRAEISNPPAYGARIVSRTLNNPDLFQEWVNDLDTMSSRIKTMRSALRDNLVRLGTPGNWDHIVSQIGMFSFTGLNPQQVDRMVDEFHVYMTKNGRISMAGLNDSNVEYVAKAIDAVVRGK